MFEVTRERERELASMALLACILFIFFILFHLFSFSVFLIFYALFPSLHPAIYITKKFSTAKTQHSYILSTAANSYASNFNILCVSACVCVRERERVH